MVYKYVATTNATVCRQKMMETQMRLNLEDEVREFVGDFNKRFKDLKEWTEDAIQIKTWREFFEKSIPRCLAILLKLKWILRLPP